MASNMESSINKGCDFIFDFSCFTCQENDRHTEAEVYCEKCSKLYCSKCVEHHNYLYKKHALLSKKNISQWPDTDVVEQEKCKEHRKEKLTIFCEDHSQLICHVCHVHIHQKCNHVVLITDKVKDLHQKGDFKQLSASFDTQYQQLIHKKDDLEENIKSLEKSHKKILEEINALRKKINDSLDQLEKNTKKELDTFLINMRTSIQTDIKQCSECMKNIACLKEDWLGRKDNSEVQSLIKYRRCLDQSLNVDAVLQEMTKNNEMTLTFNPDTTIKQILSTLSGLGQILSTVKQSQLAKSTKQNTVSRQKTPKASIQSALGNQTAQELKVKKSNPEFSSSRQYSPGNKTSDLTKTGQVSDPVSSSSHQLVQGHKIGAENKPDQIIKVKSSKKYSVNIKGDEDTCNIAGICETASGELLILDKNNRKVKLMNQTYKVVAHLQLPWEPEFMCSIDDSLVAVTMRTKQVHFIRVSNRQLIKDRILELQHNCRGIAHQHGNMYINDGLTLYLYTMEGSLVTKMYQGESYLSRGFSCAVSPDGDRIYLANPWSGQLDQQVTLSRNGTVISTLHPALSSQLCLPGLHVTDSGQLLVCCYGANTIIQMDRNGTKRLAEVVTQKDGVTKPKSVYYSKNTGSLIVGMADNNYIIVLNSQ